MSVMPGLLRGSSRPRSRCRSFVADAACSFSSDVMTPAASGRRLTNATSASTLGRMLPSPNWPCWASERASALLRWASHRCSGVPKLTATPSTPVGMISRSAPSSAASRADARSLSTTASTPTSAPASSRATGTPPPPAVTTTAPWAHNARTTGSSTISIGIGEATVRRQPRPASSTIVQPSVFGETLRRGFVHEGADGLRRDRRRQDRRAIDHRLSHQRHDRLVDATRTQLVAQRLEEHVADGALGVGRPRSRSGTGSTSSWASSERRRMNPTCGPLPCVMTRFQPASIRSTSCGATEVTVSYWSGIESGASASRTSAFPPSATTASPLTASPSLLRASWSQRARRSLPRSSPSEPS